MSTWIGWERRIVTAVHSWRGRIGGQSCLLRMGGGRRALVAWYWNASVALIVDEGAVIYFAATLRTDSLIPYL